MLKLLLNKLLDDCIDVYGVEPENLFSNSRRQEVVYARMTYVSVAKELYDPTYREIAQPINKTLGAISYMLAKSRECRNRYFLACTQEVLRRANLK